jgi:3-oxoacyl-[acyl-carrier protein] reductase
MGRLSGKVAVVTGASKGIGAATARALAADGASVVVNYLTSQGGADEVVAHIVDGGGTAVAIGADVTKAADVARLFDEAETRYGAIDILVNNAGVFGFAPLASFTEEEYHRQFQVNVLGLLLATRAAVPHLAEQGASIINISSVVSTLAPIASTVSGGSKAAVDAITKSLAKELGPRGIRVNAINPGVIMTEGLVSAGLAGSDFEKNAVALTPLGRVGQPDDIALPVAFLASDDARWITGETIIASGGEGM